MEKADEEEEAFDVGKVSREAFRPAKRVGKKRYPTVNLANTKYSVGKLSG